jgi:hypothetical protein
MFDFSYHVAGEDLGKKLLAALHNWGTQMEPTLGVAKRALDVIDGCIGHPALVEDAQPFLMLITRD